MTLSKGQGFVVFFTGLSGSGKSTLSNALTNKLIESNIPVTHLDGDCVREHLSKELGFSKEHRDLNILRLAYVATEITKHAGITICSAIAPYQSTRKKVRNVVEKQGVFIEVYMSTPLEVCEKRDVKGLYAKARTNTIKNFTGVSSPYEIPTNPDLTIDTSDSNIDECLNAIINLLISKRCLFEK